MYGGALLLLGFVISIFDIVGALLETDFSIIGTRYALDKPLLTFIRDREVCTLGVDLKNELIFDWLLFSFTRLGTCVV